MRETPSSASVYHERRNPLDTPEIRWAKQAGGDAGHAAEAAVFAAIQVAVVMLLIGGAGILLGVLFASPLLVVIACLVGVVEGAGRNLVIRLMRLSVVLAVILASLSIWFDVRPLPAQWVALYAGATAAIATAILMTAVQGLPVGARQWSIWDLLLLTGMVAINFAAYRHLDMRSATEDDVVVFGVLFGLAGAAGFLMAYCESVGCLIPMALAGVLLFAAAAIGYLGTGLACMVLSGSVMSGVAILKRCGWEPRTSSSGREHAVPPARGEGRDGGV